MPKPEDYQSEWYAELSGLLIAAFAEADASRLAGKGNGDPEDLARTGRFALGQFRKAREFLKRVAEWAEAKAAEEAKAKVNGQMASGVKAGGKHT